MRLSCLVGWGEEEPIDLSVILMSYGLEDTLFLLKSGSTSGDSPAILAKFESLRSGAMDEFLTVDRAAICEYNRGAITFDAYLASRRAARDKYYMSKCFLMMGILSQARRRQ